MKWYNLGCLLVIITVIIIILKKDLLERVNNSKVSRRFDLFCSIVACKYYNYVIILFFLTGVIVRIFKFGIIPSGVNQDGAMGAVDALALAEHGTDRFGMHMPVHFTAWEYGQMSVLLSYLSVPFIKIFGLNVFAARLPVLIISLIALWILYSTCKLFFGRGAALTVLGFCAINPWHIMQSRWALDCNMLPHFFLFSVYFICLAIKKNRKFIYISMFLFGLTMYTYGIAWYIVPLFLSIVLIFLLKKNMFNIKEIALSVLAYIFVSWPIFAVMLVNLFKLNTIYTPLFTIPYFPNSRRASDILFFSSDFFEQLSNNFNAVINNVILQLEDLPWNSIPEYGVVYLFTIPFLILGIAASIEFVRYNQINLKEKQENIFSSVCCNYNNDNTVKDKKILVSLILIWLLIGILTGLTINNVNINRINIIFYPIIIFCGVGIYSLVSRIKLFGIVVVIIYTISFSGFVSSYFGQHSITLGTAFYDGFGEAMHYVEDMDYDTIYITNYTQSDNSRGVSEILALFHHQIDGLYFQGETSLYSKSDKKLLPYKERYRYVKMDSLKINHNERAVYIVNNNEIKLFDENYFKIKKFK